MADTAVWRRSPNRRPSRSSGTCIRSPRRPCGSAPSRRQTNKPLSRWPLRNSKLIYGVCTRCGDDVGAVDFDQGRNGWSTNSIKKLRFRPTIYENGAMANVDAASSRKNILGALESQLSPKHRLSKECAERSNCLPAIQAARPRICLWSTMGFPPTCWQRLCSLGLQRG